MDYAQAIGLVLVGILFTLAMYAVVRIALADHDDAKEGKRR